MIFSEVLKQFSGDTDPENQISLFTGALRHPDALIRRAALENFTLQSDADTSRLVHLLSDPDYINVELSLRKLCTFMPEKANYWLSKTAGETGWRGMNIRIAWLGIKAKTGDSLAIDELKNYASPSFEFETRINAIKELLSLGFLDFSHAINLVKASQYWNPKLSKPASDAIGKYISDKKNKTLIEKAFKQENLTMPEFTN